MRKVIINVSDELRKRLRILSIATGKSMADFMREGIEEKVDREEKALDQEELKLLKRILEKGGKGGRQI